MRSLVSLVFLVMTVSGFCQQACFDEFIIKTAPLGFIEPVRPMLSVGFEKGTNTRLSFCLSGGYKYINNRINDDYFNQGFRLNGELRWYTSRLPFDTISNINMRKVNNPYFALEFFHIGQDVGRFLTTYDGYEAMTDSYSVIQTDEYAIDKKVYGVHIKIGRQKRWLSRLILDYYVGLGLRYKDISSVLIASTTINDVVYRPDPDDNQENFPRQNLSGYLLMPSLSCGVNLGILTKVRSSSYQ